jgi:DNA recombination protein RmuC
MLLHCGGILNAYEMNIIIVSPSTLIATLRTIASIWRQEYQNRNAQEIARQGGALYDKFVGFLNDLVEIGKKLDDTQKAYKASMNKLSDGKGNLIKKAQDIKELGASTSKNLPQNLLDRAK